MTTQFCTVKI